MKKYGAMHTKRWTSRQLRRASDRGKLLMVYFLTGPHCTMIGCFRLPIGYICEDLQWDRQTAMQTLAELVELGFATVDYEAQWVLIHDFLELNPIENPNQAKAAAKLVDQVPTDCGVYGLLGRELRKYGSRLDPALLRRFEATGHVLEIGVARDSQLAYEEELNEDPAHFEVIGQLVDSIGPVLTGPHVCRHDCDVIEPCLMLAP